MQLVQKVLSPEDAALNWLVDKVDEVNRTGRIFSDEIQLTPALATVLMQMRNPENRAISPTNLRYLISEIRGGRFLFNGEPIIISIDGLMNDGQHRCEAVIATGHTIRTMITIGVDRASRHTVDTGKVRSGADFLSMDGVPHAKQATMIAGWLWQYRHFETITTSPDKRPTKSQIQEAYASNAPDIQRALDIVPARGVAALGGRGWLAFCYVMFHRIDAARAERFISTYISGTGLNKGDPVHTLRNRFLFGREGRHAVTSLEAKAEAFFRAWNADVRGETLTTIQIHDRIPRLERPRA